MNFRNFISLVLCAVLLLGAFSACSDATSTEETQKEASETVSEENTEKQTEKETEKMTENNKKPSQDKENNKDNNVESNKDMTGVGDVFAATVYDVAAIKTADKTAAGSLRDWKGEVMKSGRNNDDPTENAVIISPYHKLTVNGTEVPVYTARCAKSPHSFAWIDITTESEFTLELSLEALFKLEKCVVLPESRGVAAEIDGKIVTSKISDVGSYTYTFTATDSEHTDPTLAPLTIMVTREEKLEIPEGYTVKEIKPGFHQNNELEFTQSNTVYYFKKGYHDISSIGLPSNSLLYIERGAYLQVTDRQLESGGYDTKTAIHADNVSNVKIISRGLLDCGKLQGGDGKYKHVVNTARSKNVLISGMTIINSNTWTICAYSAEAPIIERNLLLSYRTYSDGIMMSECTNGIGRYNFVRTGDDSIEFKGTGWWEGKSKVGRDCLYEYNDIWTDKGAGYCLTWEAECSMENMTFRNNSIGFAQPIWTDRNTALDCLGGTNANASWSNILFENIEIYCVISPNAINVQVQNNGIKFENITFKNITVSHANSGVYAFRMNFNAKGGRIADIVLDNVTFCGKRLTADDLSKSALFCNQAKKFFGGLTVK